MGSGAGIRVVQGPGMFVPATCWRQSPVLAFGVPRPRAQGWPLSCLGPRLSKGCSRPAATPFSRGRRLWGTQMEGALSEVLDRVTGNSRIWPCLTLNANGPLGLDKSWSEHGYRVGRSKKLKRGVSELDFIPPKTLGSGPGSWLCPSRVGKPFSWG